jgi:peptide subunit release factor RF-3
MLLLLLLLQVLYSTDEYITDPILAAVGQLQFEVVQYRMKVSSQRATVAAAAA